MPPISKHNRLHLSPEIEQACAIGDDVALLAEVVGHALALAVVAVGDGQGGTVLGSCRGAAGVGVEAGRVGV